MIDTPEFELDIYVTFAKDTDLPRTAQIIEERLQRLPMVNQVEAAPEQLRMTGVEVVAAIAIAVLALRGSRQAVKELHELIWELRSLFKDLGGEDPSLNIGGQQISLTGDEPTNTEITSVVDSWYKSRLPPPPDRFDVCIVCALADEARACMDVISRQCNVEFTANFSPICYEYVYTTITNNKGEPLTVQVSWLPEYGLSTAAIHFVHVLEQFKPLFVGMTGICAGDKRKVKLGDIIVADRAFVYETGKYVEGKNGQAVHLFDVNPYHADPSLIQFARMFDGWKKDAAFLPRPASKHQQRDWLLSKLLDNATPHIHDIPLDEHMRHAPAWREIVSELRKEPVLLLNEDLALVNKDRVYKLDEFPFRDPQEPECYIAPVASSHAVHSDNPFSEAQIPLRKTLAFDMEGAALYEVAANFPHTWALMVKAVSDYGDKDKDDSYHDYASAISALYMLNLIRAYMISERIQEFRGANR